MSGPQSQLGHAQRGHAQRVRCAIYTRKSSDEGLEQDFNSLDAQREACGAYIMSQASEGWFALGERYDDGGVSGGTLERPALQRLLADVAARRVDIIVVYKVDRLSRSLFDFAKLVEAFDVVGASFVSITQSFNTTTSMGRLTLNMLLSFAQFEREVTAERIRDKIAASKARGMWMGGTPPLGYRPDGRSLAVVEEHAAIVRDIFARYLASGSVRLVAAALIRAGIRAPLRTYGSTGKTYGGVVFTRGQIYAFLKCPTYIGEVHHGGMVYPALHAAIIDRDTWDRVQLQLADNTQGQHRRGRAASPSLLAGLVVDQDGEPLIASHANKGSARYRYYVSRAAHHDGEADGMRIPARELEVAVAELVSATLRDPLALAGELALTLQAHDVARLIARGHELARLAAARDHALLRAVIAQVRITSTGFEVALAGAAIAGHLQLAAGPDTPEHLTRHASLRLTRSGRAMRLVQDDGAAPAAATDASLIALLIKARRWWSVLREGELGVAALGAREKISPAYVTRIVRLAFLSPAVVEAVLGGRLRAGVSAKTLTLDATVPACWGEQRAMMLPTV